MNEKQLKQLKIAHTSGGRAWAYCIFHNDKHTPNLSITLKGQYAGRWKCWACGKTGKIKKSNSVIKLDYSGKCKSYCDIDWGKLQAYYVTQLNRLPLLKEILCKQLDVSAGSIERFRVGYEGSAYTIPMYRHHLYVDGIQKRFPDGHKQNIKQSRLGMFMPRFMCDDTETLYICEGFSDTIAVANLGFNVIGIPCTCFDLKIIRTIVIDLYFHFGIQDIIVIPDNDEVGIESAEKIRKGMPIDTHIFEFRGAKDIRDYIAKVGKLRVRQELEEI